MLSTGDLIFAQKTSCFMLFERFNAVKDTYTLNKSVVLFFMHVSLLISTEFELSFFSAFFEFGTRNVFSKHLAVYFSPDFVCMVQNFYQRSLPNKAFLLFSFFVLFCFVFLVKRLSIKYIGCLDNGLF